MGLGLVTSEVLLEQAFWGAGSGTPGLPWRSKGSFPEEASQLPALWGGSGLPALPGARCAALGTVEASAEVRHWASSLSPRPES